MLDAKTPPLEKADAVTSPMASHKVLVGLFRAYAKSVTWRFVAGADTFTLTFLATHNPLRALAVASSESITKTLLIYPTHELLWNMVPYGLKDKKPTNWRSLTKAVTYRIMGSADTLLLTWFYTGKIDTASLVAGAELFTKIPLYYLNERVWKNIDHEKLTARICSLPRHASKLLNALAA